MKLILGDCLEKLKELPDNSVDSIVTDPPYGISFMGKEWDYDVPSVEVWKEVLRVLKHGGHALVACGTRTQHRMAVNLEDAGFEIRDIVAWIYGSGFPKSLNIGKSIEAKELTGSSNKTAFKHLDGRKIKVALGYNKNNEEGDFRPNDYNGRETTTDHILHTENAKKWEGWGTALKPAMELWTLCRKPLAEKTVAENALKWGVGGINIDGCRVGTEEDMTKRYKSSFQEGNSQFVSQTATKRGERMEIKAPASASLGRFPANLIHDGSDEVVEGFPNSKSTGGQSYSKTSDIYGEYSNDRTVKGCGFGDNGSASRFFYCAKSSRSERNKGLEGFEDVKQPKIYADDKWSKENMGNTPAVKREPVKNNHPTVKPVSLMRYLCKLITPKGGVILDPYMGSGTTGIGAKLEGFDFIGIEREEDYLEIAQARIDAWKVDEQLRIE